MKVLKFALPMLALAGLCSFVFVQSSTKSEDLPIEQTYKNFLAKFDKVELPYSVEIKRHKTREAFYDAENNNSADRKEGKYIGREFGDILPEVNRGMMSRMGPDDYEAEVMLAAGKNFDAVIYSRSASFRGSKTYYVATFDKKGKMLGKMAIASQNYSSIEECKVSKDLVINVEKYKIEGMNSLEEEDTDLTYTLASSKEYVITAAGNIESTTAKNNSPEQQQAAKKDMGMR